MEYEITDKGREKLEGFMQKDAPKHPAAMAEGEILYWLDRSSEEGSRFIESNKGTWRTDPIGGMRRAGLIGQLPRQEALFSPDF